MIDDAKVARDALGDGEWAVTPRPEDLRPEAEERREVRELFRGQLAEGPGAVVVTHTDADGLGSATMVAYREGPRDGIAIRPVDYNGAYRLEHAVEDLRDFDLSGTRVYITDLGCDEPVDGLAEVARDAESAQWWDHHQWSGDDRDEVAGEAGWDVHVDTDECATSLLCRDLLVDPPERMEELARVTKDHDLWVHDIPWSDRLGAAAMALPDERYVAAALEHGPHLDNEAWGEVDRWLDTQERLEELAVDRADRIDVAGVDAAFTYTRGARTSEVGNELVEREDDPADVAVVMKTGGGGSVYSHSEDGSFDKCHLVAGELGGGGHPTAAGFGAPLERFRDLAEYWATCGGNARPSVIAAIEEVAE